MTAPTVRRVPTGPRLVAYDLPLRPDLIIRVVLPVELTEADAERLCDIIRSLAISTRGGQEV